jgi:hypothetical protein
MSTKEKIKEYISSQPEAKRKEMQELHQQILKLMPKAKLWFLDGKDAKGKQVTNPDIGYGSCNIKYKDGSMREFYQVGLSATATGISVYIMGLDDKTYLPKTFGKQMGKATVSGYCIRFKGLKDIDNKVLESAIQYGFDATRK